MKPTLQEARERYPVGTEFNPPHLSSGTTLTVKSTDFYYNSAGDIEIRNSYDYSYTPIIWDKMRGKWADIKFSPKAVLNDLPSEWALKVTPSNLNKVNAWRSSLGKGDHDSDYVYVYQEGWGTHNSTSRPLITDEQFDEFLKSKGITSHIGKTANKIVEIPKGIDAVAIKCIKDCPHYSIGDITWVKEDYVKSGKLVNGAVIHPEDNKYFENYYDCFELLNPIQDNSIDQTQDLGDIEFLRDHPIILQELINRSKRKSLDGYKSSRSVGGDKGFDWSSSREGHDFWSTVLSDRNPEHYYTKYPRESKSSVELNPITGLPEKWFAIITKENIEMLQRFRDTTSYKTAGKIDPLEIDGLRSLKSDGERTSYHSSLYTKVSQSELETILRSKGIDTSLSKSISDSLGSMSSEKWAVTITQQNIHLLNRWRRKVGYYTFTEEHLGNFVINNCSQEYTLPSNYTLIPDYQLVSHLQSIGIDVSNPHNPFPVGDIANRMSEMASHTWKDSSPKKKTIQVELIPVKQRRII